MVTAHFILYSCDTLFDFIKIGGVITLYATMGSGSTNSYNYKIYYMEKSLNEPIAEGIHRQPNRKSPATKIPVDYNGKYKIDYKKIISSNPKTQIVEVSNGAVVTVDIFYQ